MFKNDCYRKAKMNVLLKDEIESFYWMGFLMADGYFTKRFEVRLTLSINDIEHLSKYANFTKCKNISISKNGKYCSIAFRNMDIFEILCNKFNINNRKTYNPPDFSILNNFNRKLVYSFIVGFIDGDGSIKKLYKREDCNITIQLHSSWINNLIYIENFIYDYFNLQKDKILSKVRNNGYSRLNISNSIILGKMKKEVIRLNIPYMKRKWNIIDENFVSKYIKTKINRDNTINLYLSGLTTSEIKDKLNLKLGVIYKYIREYKNKII